MLPHHSYSRLLSTALALTCSFALLGCSDQAAQDYQARQDLTEALVLLDQAESGFVPNDQGEDYQDYRQQQLAKVIPALDKASQSSDAGTRVTAQRLLADIHLSQSRHQAREATLHASKLSNQTAVIVGLLGAVDSAQARASRYTPRTAEAEVKLQAQSDELLKEVRALKGEFESLSVRQRELTKQREQHIADRDAMRTEAHKFEQAAFTLTGEAAREKYEAAVKAQAEASGSQAKADQLEAEIQKLEDRRQSIDADRTGKRKSLNVVNEQIASIDDLNRQRRDLTDDALAQRDQAMQELTTALNTVAEDYNQKVAPVFEEALASVDKAVAVLETAAQQAGRDRNAVRLHLLSAKTERVNLLVTQHLALSSYMNAYKLVAENAPRLAPDRAAEIADTYSQVRAVDSELIATARTNIEEATALGQELTDSADSDTEQIVAKRLVDLQRFLRRIS